MATLPYKYVNELIPSILPRLEQLEKILMEEEFIDPALDDYENLVKSWHLVRAQMAQVEPELGEFCLEEWNWLDQVDEGLVCCHSLAALATAYSLPPFKALDFHDQNIIIYGLIFHDIAKRGPPEIDTKDPLHPFTSAAKALKIFNRLGWLPNPDQVEETSSLISSSFFFHKWANFMDNRNLPIIYQKLLYATGLLPSPTSNYSSYSSLTSSLPREKLFVFEILAVILFHQSIDFNPQFPNFTPLSSSEIRKFFSPRLMHLLSILVMGDSGSYNLRYKRKTWKYVWIITETCRGLVHRYLSSNPKAL